MLEVANPMRSKFGAPFAWRVLNKHVRDEDLKVKLVT